MAQIDLYGSGAQRVRSAYRDYLGRDSSDDEVSNWLTGGYGHGDQNNLDPVIAAIQQSDEARRRQIPNDWPRNDTPPVVPRPGTPTAPPPTNLPIQGIGQRVQNTATAALHNDPRGDHIRSLYRNYLGRDASDDEVGMWYGRGAEAELGIINSEESLRRHIPIWYQQYLGRDATPYDIAQWAARGNFADIQRGIQESPEARQRGQNPTPPPSAPPPNTPAPSPPPSTGSREPIPGGDARTWFLNTLTAGMAPSGRNLESLGPQLARYGIQLGPRNASGMIDTIILPDGSRWDVIESATLDGGVRWHWQPAGGSGGGVGGGTLPGNQFTDQYTQLLESMIRARLGMLQGGIDDPMRQQYQDAMQRRAQMLAQAEPQYQQLMSYLQRRFGDLQGPGYTGAENEVIRTGALDPIERDRAAARQRVMEQISARGFTPDSGIAQAMLRDVDAEFDGMRSETQTVLTTSDLNRRESRQQRAEMLGAQLVDIPQARAREQLDVFGALEQLERLMRDEEEARSREAINYSGALADLGPQRLQLAMQAAGMGGNPSSFFNNLMGMSQMNQNASLLRSQNSRSLWSGLGSIAAMLMNSGR